MTKKYLTSFTFHTFIIIIFLIPSKSQSQHIYFKFKDGTTNSFKVDEIRHIVFNDNIMILRNYNGNTVSWNINNVANYRYNTTTGLTSILVDPIEINIYPNPFKDIVRIRYNLSSADKISIQVMDMQGRTIRTWPQIQKTAGTHELVWHTGDAESRSIHSGTYVVHINTTKGSANKMIVVE